MWQIGPHAMTSRVLLAPMAGVSDLPFRQLCRQFGAALTTGEMVTAQQQLWSSRKSGLRLSGLHAETEPRSVQIAGSEPALMADAARACVERGAQIIDINMGCPAKKVCRKAAGSALLRDEPLVAAILSAVTRAVDVPVTLKIRTGWCPDTRNAVQVARMAEDCGIQALAVHGRTRACGYHQPAEYATIADLVSRVRIPVIANGDITSAEQALHVLRQTGACAVMIGRAAHGQPWLLREVARTLAGEPHTPMSTREQAEIVLQHLHAIHTFYGAGDGVKMARKHMVWYGQQLGIPSSWRGQFNQLPEAQQQIDATRALFAVHRYTGNYTNTVEERAA